MTRPKVPDDKRQRTAQACDSCKRRKQKVRCLFDLFCLLSLVLCRPRFERLRYPISFMLLAGSMSVPSHNSSYKHPTLGYQIMPWVPQTHRSTLIISLLGQPISVCGWDATSSYLSGP
ncbi:hypothetical protein QR685DRAFT_434424 [Neurospora intermedia]|uniref:Zn(2)-C6 fungal-type domain-containing protein n=1 Tax=Neurospora intermedia TaxID=5142 RepID=A0ABR3DLL5_NEUIN